MSWGRLPTDERSWVFVSHSHRDLEAVRRVRNELEEKGHDPLLFFLKSLDDNAELHDLIRREIGARETFLLCDSENARTSRWVQQELEIIKQLPDKVSRTVDLGAEWEEQRAVIADLSRNATIFLSYAASNRGTALKLRGALQQHDYRVWLDVADLEPGMRWEVETRGALDRAVERGFVLALLSPAALNDSWVLGELEQARERSLQIGRQNSIVPVIVRDLSGITPPRWLAELHHADFTRGDPAENVRNLVAWLRRLSADPEGDVDAPG